MPFYDVLTAEPSLAAHEINRNKVKLAMTVGAKRHYRLSDIHGRHFVETAQKTNMPDTLTRRAVKEGIERCEPAFAAPGEQLPRGFPEQIFNDTRTAALERIPGLGTAHGQCRRGAAVASYERGGHVDDQRSAQRRNAVRVGSGLGDTHRQPSPVRTRHRGVRSENNEHDEA